MGPLLLLYFNYTSIQTKRFRWIHLLHFLVPILAFITIINEIISAFDLYVWANHFLMAYLIYIGYQHVFAKHAKIMLTRWHFTLFYAVVALWLIFSLQLYISNRIFYIWGIVLASLVMYIMFFVALRSPSLRAKKYQITTPEDVKDKIVHALEVDKMFAQPGISITQFSEAINTPVYLVSNGIKSIYRRNFKDVVNGLRIKEITTKLANDDFANEKIESMAFDVGFNTSSAFYSAFKKETNMMPRAYQKRHQKI